MNSADCQGPLGAISDDAGIQALAYTFLANVTIFSATDAVDQAPAFDKADRCFALALRAFPDSPRAELGRAAISFQRTREVCNSGVETDALVAPVELLDALISTEAQYLAARSNYRTAVENGRKEIPFLETATNIGIGRIQLCLSLAGEPRWDEARASFGEAVTAYAVAQSGEQRRLASLTAEAYAGIGLVVLRGPRTFDPEVAEQSNEAWAAFSAAVTDEERAQAQTLVDAATAKSQAGYQEHFASAEAAFDEAIQLVGDDGRRRLFHAMRANARSTLGNLEGSTQDCIEAQNGDTELSCPDFGPSFFDLPPDEVLGLAITGSSTALFARVATLLITVGAMLVLVERTVLARRD